MAEKKIKIIPHTHWDKEWYFTSARSLVYSLKDFDEVLDILDADPDFKCFHLDGQLSIVEEYLELHPEREEQFARLVKEGRLIIGPWYTQPDTLVVSGESLLKNLEIGMKSIDWLSSRLIWNVESNATNLSSYGIEIRIFQTRHCKTSRR